MRPEDSDAAYLWDMLQAARTAQRFLGQTKLDEYLRNDLLQSAVERKIEIIGEAANHVSKAFKQAHPEIPWKSIISQRNVMVHDYGEIKSERIWGVAKTHLAELADKLEPLLPPLPPELDLREPQAVYRPPEAARRRRRLPAHAGPRSKKHSKRRV
jgi:uncharacterized protein with HEPN domain